MENGRNVFSNPDARVDELVEAYLFFERTEEQLRGNIDGAIEKLVALQQASLLGEPNAKHLKEARDRYTDLSFQLRACVDGKDKIVAKLELRLPVEAEESIKQIDEVLRPEIDKRRAVLTKRYHAALAEAISIKELLDGRRSNHIHHDFLSIVMPWDREPLLEEIRRHRQKISDERHEIGKNICYADCASGLQKQRDELQGWIHEPLRAVHSLLMKAGAKDYQAKPKPALPDDPGSCLVGGREERNVREEIGMSAFMGYTGLPVPR